MKKTITMLIAGLFSVSGLMAQALPMVVCGSLKNNGILKSSSEVVVSNAVNGGVIENAGTLNLPGGITYVTTHDDKDGLLHNTGIVTLPVANPEKVILKRSGLTPSTINDWDDESKNTLHRHYISFPFAVDINEIYNLNVTKGMTGLWFYKYNAAKRATTGEKTKNWELINDYEPAEAVLSPMIGYYFIYTASSDLKEIQFPAHSLVNSSQHQMYQHGKHVQLVYNKNDQGKFPNGWGWNIIGPPYTANYTYSSETLEDLEGFIYHYSNIAKDFVNYDLDGDEVVVAPFSHTHFQWTGKANTSLIHNYTHDLKFYHQHGLTDRPNHPNFKSVLSGKELIKLDLSGTRSVLDDDVLRVSFSDEYTENTINGEKMFSESAIASRFWAEFKGSQLFSIKLPFVDQVEIPLGFRAGEDGEYTLKLNSQTQTNYESIVLIDKNLGKETDLTSQIYSFDSPKGVDNSRFVLAINRTALFVNNPVSGVGIYASNNLLHVKGIDLNDRVQVFDITGKLIESQVANATELQVALPHAGIYLVKIAGSHNLTSKVINK